MYSYIYVHICIHIHTYILIGTLAEAEEEEPAFDPATYDPFEDLEKEADAEEETSSTKGIPPSLLNPNSPIYSSCSQVLLLFDCKW
jgi:hypothetical protein